MRYSIIIPVYMVESTLRRCVESAVAVCTEDDEILLVDDGSPDRSGEIADELAGNYSGIRVIHKKNGGLSDARNTGLLAAKGEYVLFLDSDDYLDSEEFASFRKSTEAFPHMQIYYCDVLRLRQGATHRMSRKNVKYGQVYTGPDFFKEELSGGQFRAMAPSGVYSRSFLLDHKLFFVEGLLHEDEEWSPRVLLAAKSVVCLQESFYRYEIRCGSITQRADKTENAKAQLEICREHTAICEDLEDVALCRVWKRYIAKMYMHAASVEIRAGLRRTIQKEYVAKTWITGKDFLRFQLFMICPGLYAKVIDRYWIR